MSSDEYDGERRRRRRRRRQSSSGSRRYREEHRHGQDEADDGGTGEVRPDERPEISLRTLILVLATFAGVVLIGGGGWYYYRSITSPEALAFAEARNQPLVDMVIADQPEAARRLRAAVEQDVRQPNKDGPSREAEAISALRSEFIAPTMRRADDASLVATMAARAALIEQLNRTDTRICREFALGGIKNPEKLDPEAERLYKELLTAVAAAYRSGRSATQSPPMPDLRQVTNMLYEAGFIKSDFDKLNSFSTLSNDITCYIVLKVNQVPSKLKPEERGPYARFVLGN